MFRHLASWLFAAVMLSQCASPAKSVPPTLEKESWKVSDGKELPYTRWPADPAKPDSPRAVIICVHGLSGAASDFWPVGESLELKNFAIYGMQLRGQGNDPDQSTRGDIQASGRWLADLQDFTLAVRGKHPHVPILWYGESLGSLIVVHTLASLPADSPARPSAVVLSSPVINFRQELPFWKYWTFRTVACLLPGKRVALESLGESEVKVTNNTTHRQQMEKTPHYVEHFTLRLFREVEKLVRRADEAAAQCTLPILVFYTPNDVFTSREQVEFFFHKLGSADKQKVFYPESYHLLLHDKDRPNVLRDLEAWLDQKIPAR